MYKLLSIEEFVNEANSITKTRQKLQKASSKIDKYDRKSRAAAEEVKFRKDQLEYEQAKERLRRERDSTQTPTEKAKAQEELAKLKKTWKGQRKEATDRIKNMRKGA